jgi:hypothetical protein
MTQARRTHQRKDDAEIPSPTGHLFPARARHGFKALTVQPFHFQRSEQRLGRRVIPAAEVV